MGRRGIVGAENKIIVATVAVAGQEIRGSFSTKEVALKAGVSEFTIFSHFHDKESLLEAADQFLFERFCLEETRLEKLYLPDEEALFNGLLDYFLSDVSALRFIGNYSALFPREGEIDSYEAFTKRFEKAKPFHLASLADLSPKKERIRSFFALREIVNDALILSTLLNDSPCLRKTMFALIKEGASHFVRLAE
jgi:AcrR family transcriptional regulator